MSTRKRQHPNPPESPLTPSKRTRFQEGSSRTPEKAHSSGPACKYRTSSVAYAINKIVDEDEDKYLIEWAPDSFGNTWSQDWQSKKNANAAAVKLWETTQRSNANTDASGRRPRLTITHKNAKERDTRTASTSPLISQTTSTNEISPSRVTASETLNQAASLRSSQQSVQTISSSLDITQFPDVAVQIDPRHSLNKEAYIAYRSSLSTQEASKSAGPHSDSGFEESTSRENSPSRKTKARSIIVPDSQSVPGNSTNIPDQSTSEESAESSKALVSANAPVTSSEVVIPASQPSKGAPERRGSEPAPQRRETSYASSSEFSSPPLLQIASDPEALLESSRGHRFVPRQRGSRRIISDSSNLSQDSPPSHPFEVPLQSIEPSEEAQVLIPASEARIHLTKEGDAESPVPSPVFATQVPLAFGRPSTETSSQAPIKLIGASVDPLIATPVAWQGGQIVPVDEKATSEISTVSLLQARTDSEPPNQVKERASESVISEERVDRSYPSQATTADESSPGTKYPESQVENHPQEEPSVIRIVEHRAVQHRSVDNSLDTSELSELPNHQLPDTIDSRIPPKPPTSSETDMPEIAPSAESRLESRRREFKAVQATADTRRAAQRVERMQSNTSTAHTPRPLGRINIEDNTKPAIAIQSPKGPKSPSLARIAVTPKGPLSPTTLGSPLGIQIASPRSAQSPSKIPEKEPYHSQEEPSYLGVDPTEMAKDLPTPMMASQQALHPARSAPPLGGDSTADDVASTQSESLLQTTSLRVQNLGPMEFIMPLSMPPRTQKQYIDTYRFFQRKIALFGEAQDVSRDIVEDLNTMLDRVAKVTTHMDLDGGGPGSQDEVDVAGEAGYAVSVSEKFRFLDRILSLVKDLDIHIAIVARPGQLCGFIETTLKAQRINYCLLTDHESNDVIFRDSGSRSNVSLLSSGTGGSKHTSLSRRADLVIAFDETFDAKSLEVRALRCPMSEHDRLAPVIRLVVYATLEHIHLCLPFTLEPNDRLRKLLYYMVHAEIAVGQLAPANLHQSPFDPSHCAEQLIEYVLAGAIPGTCTLPSIPPIEDLPILDSDSSLSDVKSDISFSHKPEGKIRYWPNPVIPKTSPSRRILGEKRPLDLDYGDSLEVQTKKMRMGILASKGRQAEFPGVLRDLRENQHIRDLERRVQYAEANMYEPGNPMSWESRVNLFEKANRERRELRATVANLQTTVQRLTLNLSTSKEETAAARAAQADTNAKLHAMHDMLLNNASPDVQQAELTRRRLQELEAIDAAKSKKLTNTENDLAFTRKVYQDASTAASSASTELADLRPRFEAAEARLESAQRERKHARTQERLTLQPHLKEKVALKETLRQRDKELQAMKLELDGLKRGRQGVQTRGSSMQPVGGRSPRGSRGVSPAVMGGLVPGGHGPGSGHQGGATMARGPSGLGYSSRLGGALEGGGKMR